MDENIVLQVFVPKKMGASAAQIFDVLVRDLTSLKTKRASLEINYVSLKKGSIREARFVLGQIILRTLGFGFVTGYEVMTKEKDKLHAFDPEKNAEVLAENSHVVVDQRKCHSWSKTDKKRIITPANFVEEQRVAKKQKFFGKNSGVFEQGRSRNQMLTANTQPADIYEKKQDLVEEDFCTEVGKKHQKVNSKGTGHLLQGYASKMQEEADNHKLPREEIRSMLETLKSKVGKHELPVKEQKPADNEEYERSAEKHLKLLEQVNDDVAKKQQKLDKKSLLQREPDIEKQNVVVEYIRTNVHQTKRVLEKGTSHKHEKVKLKGRPHMLSSLFK